MARYFTNMKHKLLLILACSVLFISCKDAQKEAYLVEISDMEKSLDSMEQLAETNRIDTLPALINRIKNKTLEVQNNYYTDTIDYEVADMMNDFKQARKGLSSNSGNLAKVRNNIPEVKQKLKDLSFDINHGVGDRSRYQDYVNYEKKKVEQIGEILSYYIINKEKYIKLYNESAPKVDTFIKELKSEK